MLKLCPVWRVRSSMQERNRLSFRIGQSIAIVQLNSWTECLRRLRKILIFRTPRHCGHQCCE